MRIIIFICSLFIMLSSVGQSELKVMSYNVLNYPQGDIANREDTLGKILDYYLPDLLLLQELKSEEGLQALVDEFNEHSTQEYTSGTYVELVSNPNSGWPLQQNIIYNTEIFGIAEESVITTDYRDINYFKLFLQDLSVNQDSIFLHVMVYSP